MLQAKLKNGKMITPALYPRQKLLQLKAKQEDFYCPVCEEKVILRAGEKVIAHFAHRKEADCLIASGGEGAYHEQGKLFLYQWLCNQGLQVELEAYVSEINQRPDILIYHKDRKIAIEYQCSKISHEIVSQRTNGYKQAGIHVIWILGERLMKRRGSHIFSLDSFSQAMMHQFSPTYPLSIFYFCPLAGQLITLKDILFLGKNRAAGKLTTKPLQRTTLPELLTKENLPTTTKRTIWQKEKERFRFKTRGRRYGVDKEWRGWLYEKGYYVEQLPSIVHLPVSSAYLMRVPGWIWQSKIVLQVIAPRRVGTDISLAQCIRAVRKDLLTPEHFPLVTDPNLPISEYLQTLCSLDILEQTAETSFKKISSIDIHQHIEQAIQADSEIIHTIFLKKQS